MQLAIRRSVMRQCLLCCILLQHCEIVVVAYTKHPGDLCLSTCNCLIELDKKRCGYFCTNTFLLMPVPDTDQELMEQKKNTILLPEDEDRANFFGLSTVLHNTLLSWFKAHFFLLMFRISYLALLRREKYFSPMLCTQRKAVPYTNKATRSFITTTLSVYAWAARKVGGV